MIFASASAYAIADVAVAHAVFAVIVVVVVVVIAVTTVATAGTSIITVWRICFLSAELCCIAAGCSPVCISKTQKQKERERESVNVRKWRT